jgi:hypothetical protein
LKYSREGDDEGDGEKAVSQERVTKKGGREEKGGKK